MLLNDDVYLNKRSREDLSTPPVNTRQFRSTLKTDNDNIVFFVNVQTGFCTRT